MLIWNMDKVEILESEVVAYSVSIHCKLIDPSGCFLVSKGQIFLLRLMIFCRSWTILRLDGAFLDV